VRLDEFFAADSVATLNPRASAITASFGVNDGRGVAQWLTGCRTRATKEAATVVADHLPPQRQGSCPRSQPLGGRLAGVEK
jgi:hypothetical protein